MDSQMVLYVVTAVVSVVVAFLLAYMAGLTGHVRSGDKKKKMRQEMDSGIPLERGLAKAVYDEIATFVDSEGPRQQVTQAVSEILSRELEKRTSLNAQELGKKYEDVLKEKSKNEEVAWHKYKKVLTDKKQTEAIIRSIAEGLVVVDAKGRVVMINPAAEKLLGTQRRDKVGKFLLDGLKREQLISLIKDSPEKEDKEIELVSQQDDTKKILRASTAVVENEDGQTVGMVSVLSDITKQKELDQLKTNFVSTVSHELRTPLVAVEKSLSLILGGTAGQVTKAQEELLSIADRNLKRLAIFINDILDLSKLEAGKMEFRRDMAAFDKIVKDTIAGFDAWAKTKSIKIEREIPDGLPQVSIDANRMIQVLTNLIGNAIKYTPQDGVIAVKVRFNRQANELEVSVQDTGIGIASEDLPKVFDKFYRAGERTPTDIGGTGIGLSIAKEIVNMHGGKIWAESEHNKGAKFTFTLPVKA